MVAANLVDNITQEIPAPHAIIYPRRRWRSHHADHPRWHWLRPQVSEKPEALRAIRAHTSSLITKARSSSPVTPSGLAAQSRHRYGGSIAAGTSSRRVPLHVRATLQIIKELQKHDPREHRQAIEVAVRPLSLRMMSRADLMRLPSCWAGGKGPFTFCRSGHE